MSLLHHISLWSLTAIVLFGCGSSGMSADEYMAYINAPDNDLRRCFEGKNIDYCFQFYPEELSAHQQKRQSLTRGTETASAEELHFVFIIRSQNKQAPLKHDALKMPQERASIYMMSQMFAEAFRMRVNGKEYLPSFVHNEPNHALTLENKTHVVFPKPTLQPEGTFTLIYSDQLFGDGRIQVEFNTDLIINPPKLLS